MAFTGFGRNVGHFIILFTVLFQISTVVGYGPLKQLMGTLFDNYDNGIRPYQGVQPVKVGLTLYVLSMEDIDEQNHEFTITMYFRQSWNDGRLKFSPTPGIGAKGSNDTIVLDSTKSNLIWVPDTFFVNEKTSILHKMTVPNEFVRISSNGDVLKSQRMTLTAECPMDLTYFPMDTQICGIEIESFGYTAHDITYIWAKGLIASAAIAASTSSPEYMVTGHRTRESQIQLSTGNYSRAMLDIVLKRSPGKYIKRFYTPTTMFVSVSLLSLLFPRREIGAFVCLLNVGFINLFMAMAEGGGLRPGISYSTAIDSYFSICLHFMYICLLVSLLNLYFSTKSKNQSNSIEMHVIGRPGEIQASEDTQNLCDAPNQNRFNSVRGIYVSTFWRMWASFLKILEIVCRYVCLVLGGLFLVSILIYWANLTRASEQTDLEGIVPLEY